MTQQQIENIFSPDGWEDLNKLKPTASQAEIVDMVNTLIEYVNYLAKSNIGI